MSACPQSEGSLPAPKALRLILFFSRGVSLRLWDESGMFDREVALYRRLQEHNVQITFLTYGDARDRDYASRLPGIRILCNRWHFQLKRYMQRVHLIHGLALWRGDVIKTNQMRGADLALRAANFWRKPLIARCGYMYSADAACREGADSTEAREALKLEAQVFGAARQIVVTTPAMAADIASRLPDTASRMHVIPNYVDTALFCPQAIEPDVDLLFVGRIEKQKNLAVLLEAIQDSKITLRLIGEGSLRDELMRRYGTLDGRVQWLTRVSHAELPLIMNRARVFILPSLWEGHPKTLIEAMACARPVIGTQVEGIRELITNNENGVLCEPAVENVRQAIETVLNDSDLRQRIGQNARDYALAHFSLERIVQQELAVLRAAVKRD